MSRDFCACLAVLALAHGVRSDIEQPATVIRRRDDVRAIPALAANVEDLSAERGIDISHETVRFLWNQLGPMFAAEIRKKRVAHMCGYRQWRGIRMSCS